MSTPSMAVIKAEANYYIAGCFSDTGVVTASRAIMGVNIPSIELWRIPPGKFIAAVLSVAGGNGDTPSGCVYQNAISIHRDGTVIAAPQIWFRYGTVDAKYGPW